MLNGKKVLVTGANGFIGTHLCKRLIKEQAIVHGMIEPGTKIPKSLIDWVHFFEVDICNEAKLLEYVNKIKPEIIFHLAAVTNPKRDVEVIESTIEVNFIATLRLLKSLIHYEKLVFLSTAELYYGNTAPYNEQMKISAVSPYSASKAAAEMYIELFAKTYNKPITTLRLFLPYGPEQPPIRFIPQLIQSAIANKPFAMSKGEQTREFLFIEDAIDAMIKAACSHDANGKIINIGSGQEISLKETALLVKELTSSDFEIQFGALPYRENELWHYSADISLARTLLGWSPTVTLRQGLLKTIEWYKHET